MHETEHIFTLLKKQNKKRAAMTVPNYLNFTHKTLTDNPVYGESKANMRHQRR